MVRSTFSRTVTRRGGRKVVTTTAFVGGKKVGTTTREFAVRRGGGVSRIDPTGTQQPITSKLPSTTRTTPTEPSKPTTSTEAGKQLQVLAGDPRETTGGRVTQVRGRLYKGRAGRIQQEVIGTRDLLKEQFKEEVTRPVGKVDPFTQSTIITEQFGPTSGELSKQFQLDQQKLARKEDRGFVAPFIQEDIPLRERVSREGGVEAFIFGAREVGGGRSASTITESRFGKVVPEIAIVAGTAGAGVLGTGIKAGTFFLPTGKKLTQFGAIEVGSGLITKASPTDTTGAFASSFATGFAGRRTKTLGLIGGKFIFDVSRDPKGAGKSVLTQPLPTLASFAGFGVGAGLGRPKPAKTPTDLVSVPKREVIPQDKIPELIVSTEVTRPLIVTGEGAILITESKFKTGRTKGKSKQVTILKQKEGGKFDTDTFAEFETPNIKGFVVGKGKGSKVKEFKFKEFTNIGKGNLKSIISSVKVDAPKGTSAQKSRFDIFFASKKDIASNLAKRKTGVSVLEGVFRKREGISETISVRRKAFGFLTGKESTKIVSKGHTIFSRKYPFIIGKMDVKSFGLFFKKPLKKQQGADPFKVASVAKNVQKAVQRGDLPSLTGAVGIAIPKPTSPITPTPKVKVDPISQRGRLAIFTEVFGAGSTPRPTPQPVIVQETGILSAKFSSPITTLGTSGTIKTGINSILSPKQSSRLTTKTISRSLQRQTSRQRQRQRQIQRQAPIQQLDTGVLSRDLQRELLGSKQTSRQIQRQTGRGIQRGIGIPSIITGGRGSGTPRVPTTGRPPPPIIPELFPEEKLKKKGKGKRKEFGLTFNPFFTPSVEAKIFKIRGKRPTPRQIATGVVLRPLPIK